MSKTNHRRGTSDNRFNAGRRTSRHFRGYGKTPLSDHRVTAWAIGGRDNSEGMRRNRKGAKKYLASRTRFHENRALEKLLQAGEFEE